MSWATPKNKFIASEILDQEDWNETLMKFASELAGKLNEHNFAQGSLEGMQLAGTPLTEFGIVALVGHQQDDNSPFAAVVDADLIDNSTQWKKLNGTKYFFDSRGGKVLVIQKVQIRGPQYWIEDGGNWSLTKTFMGGVQLCPMLNDSPRLDSLIGGGDMSNDMKRIPPTTYTPPPATDGWKYYGTGPGFRYRHTGVVLTSLLDLAPGRHEVAIASRLIQTPLPDPLDLVNLPGAYSMYKQSHSTIVIDLWM